MLCLSRKVFSCAETIFSRTLEMKGNLEMGLKLANTVLSMPGFFNKGSTTACLRLTVTTPDNRLLFMMARMDCPMIGKTSLKKWGGTTSQGEP